MSDSGTGGPAAMGPGQSGPGQSGPGQSDPSPAAGESAGAAASLPKIIPFSSLVRCGDEVWIEHAGSLYRLRRTKQDKLILTK
jgi:hemin uptake protein HemP